MVWGSVLTQSTTGSSSESLSTQKNRNKPQQFSLRSPPPSQHLKKILENYPEGSQIFKEALQNADDAKANVFRVILDERTHRCQNPQLDRFMGPSVLFSNDAVFTTEDWRGLQNMFESEKTKTPGKIGRFGMGSRSYFHMTDVLSIVSGDRVAYLDPDWTITEEGGGALCLPLTDELETNEAFLTILDLMTPFQDVLGFNTQSSYYSGTLIRLPLRMGRWARTSSFAPYEYTSSNALSLLLKFKKEAAECLLFLQSVERLEFWRWSDSEDFPLELYSCSIKPDQRGDVWDKRGSIRNFLEDQRKWGQDLKATLCQADTGHLPEIDDIFTLEELEFLGTPNPDDDKCETTITLSQWLINTQLVSNSDFLPYLHFTRCPPIVGIALLLVPPAIKRERRPYDPLPFQINNNPFSSIDQHNLPTKTSPKNNDSNDCIKNTHRSAIKSSPLLSPSAPQKSFSTSPNTNYLQLNWALDQNTYDDDEDDIIRHGKAFSFLPLPDVATGLPVHIHGTFQLTDNRRSLWMAVDDTEGKAQKWSEWNYMLLTTALPQLYVRILIRFAQLTADMLKLLEEEQVGGRINWDDLETASHNILDNYYNAWPNPHQVVPAFQQILAEFVKNAKTQKLIIRQPQSSLAVSRRLAGGNSYLTSNFLQKKNPTKLKKCDTNGNDANHMPPFRPLDCHYMDLTDVEAHVFASHRDVLSEAVAQCQLLGHRVVLVPEWLMDLFKEFDFDKSNNPASLSQTISMGLKHQRPLVKQRKQQQQQQQQQQQLTTNNPIETPSNPSGYYCVTVLDIFSTILFSHWKTLPIKELGYIPHYTALMLCLCKILGRGPDKYILKFRDVCISLPFIPTRFPGIEYDDTDVPPLKTPIECFDPALNNFKISQLALPDIEFRAPDVLRVLRLWGLRQNLGWSEIAQEAVSRVCVVGGCQPGSFNYEGIINNTAIPWNQQQSTSYE